MNFNHILLLLSAFFLVTTFTGCKDDDAEQKKKIEGNWTIAGLKTDNEALNQRLPALLAASEIKLSDIAVSFSDKEASLSLPEDELKPIVAAYAYDSKQLALRFEELPIPFNAFIITKLTDAELVLSNTLSKETLALALALLKETNPEMLSMLMPFLGTDLEKGLAFDIVLIRTTVVQNVR